MQNRFKLALAVIAIAAVPLWLAAQQSGRGSGAPVGNVTNNALGRGAPSSSQSNNGR